MISINGGQRDRRAIAVWQSLKAAIAAAQSSEMTEHAFHPYSEILMQGAQAVLPRS